MDEVNIKNQFSTIMIIYSAILIGLLFFFGFSYYLVENNIIESNQDSDGVFRILVPIIGIISMFLSFKLYNSRISNSEKYKELSEKLLQYRSIKIMQWAILEGASFLSLVAFLLTGNYFYVIVLLFLIGFIVLVRPSKENFINDFQVEGIEKN
jgi:hypothetical protein